MVSPEFNVHHIIPRSVLNRYARSLPSIWGKDFYAILQSYNNRIVLFSDEKSAKTLQKLHNALDSNGKPINTLRGTLMGSAWHDKYHQGYSSAVGAKIESILSNEHLNPAQKKLMLIDMQGALREMLQDGEPPIESTKIK